VAISPLEDRLVSLGGQVTSSHVEYLKKPSLNSSLLGTIPPTPPPSFQLTQKEVLLLSQTKERLKDRKERA
jgi:hypothetical protein